MRTIFFLLFLETIVMNWCNAQSAEGEKNSVTAGVDIASRYIWRGKVLSKNACLQPNLAVSLGNFTLGAWGSYTIGKESFQEADLSLSYSVKSITLTVSDYFTPSEDTVLNSDYFNYKNVSTLHTFDVQLLWSEIGGSPLSILWSTFVYGCDKKENSTENAYSSYLELSVSKKINDYDCDAFLGISPTKGYYANNFNLVNIGVSTSKTLWFNEKYGLPVKVSVVVNPTNGKIYVCGLISF